MTPKKVLVTGVSGYFGGVLVRELEHRDWCVRVDGCDLRPPLSKLDKVHFTQLDITSPDLSDWVEGCNPDILIHLAFIVDPIHDEARMREINVGGTRAVLAAAERAQVPQVLVASSGTAYGAWPDNPVPLRESDPIRPHPEFQYAREKGELESHYQQFMDEHPDVAFSVIRPCVVYGPQVKNYLSALLTDLPVVVRLRGYDPPLQFVHEEDVARAILIILEKEARGAFNIAPSDTLKVSELMRLPGKRVIALPERLVTALAGFLWRHRLPGFGAPPSLIDFMRYPWVLDNSRLCEELGFEFRYSSRETVEVMLRSKGYDLSRAERPSHRH